MEKELLERVKPQVWGWLFTRCREQDSRTALASLMATNHADAAYQIAQVYAYRDPGLPEIKPDPLLKILQHDPRFTELLKKMRLPA
jgi:hypothetical protein